MSGGRNCRLAMLHIYMAAHVALALLHRLRPSAQSRGYLSSALLRVAPLLAAILPDTVDGVRPHARGDLPSPVRVAAQLPPNGR